MAMENIGDAVNRLTVAGFEADFRSENGQLRAAGQACRHPPQAFEVHEVVRWEGASDPGDEAILFALECREHGIRGTYTAAYGPTMAKADEEIVRTLDVRDAALPLSNR